MAFDLGQCLKSVTYEKTNIFSEISDGYPSFIINRSMSYFPDTIMYAYEASRWGYDMKSNMNYYYWLESIPKRKRFSKWGPKPKNSDVVQAMIFIYGISRKKAEFDEKCLSDGEKKELVAAYKSVNP